MLEINFGPQHPSTHGVFRMIVQLEGEKVCGLKPIFGYLHRNHEQIAENLPYAAIMPYTDRLDYVNALANNFGYALTIEKLEGLEVPERAEYIRVIMAELARVVKGLGVDLIDSRMSPSECLIALVISSLTMIDMLVALA